MTTDSFSADFADNTDTLKPYLPLAASIRVIRGKISAMNRRLFLSAAAKAYALGAAGLPLLLGGCLNVKTEPIEVKPIHITVDVNVRVEKALDDFFGDLDKKSTTLAPAKS